MTFALVKHNNNSISAITTAGSLTSGGIVLIKEQTASSSSTINFVHGSSSVVFDNTYPIYLFKFINCHPSDDEAALMFNLSSDTGSNYNVTKTTTNFRAYNNESGSPTALQYQTAQDLAQSTGDATIGYGVGNDNDQSLSGELYLFKPSSTTFVKHFMSTCNLYEDGNFTIVQYGAGYANTTSAIDAIKFNFDTGTIDSGTIKLYGIKGS